MIDISTSNEFLNQDELNRLKFFLNEKNINASEAARKLNIPVFRMQYYLRENRVKRLLARELIKILEEKALEGFEKVKF